MVVLMKFPQVFLSYLMVTAGIVEGCPVGWTRLSNSSCYLLLNSPLRSQYHVRLFCQQLGASIAVLSDRSEIDRVYGWLASIGIVDVWVGLHASETGEWVWDDGEEFNETWWGPGEPDEGSHNAGTIYKDGDVYGIWDLPDSYPRKTLCQLISESDNDDASTECSCDHTADSRPVLDGHPPEDEPEKHQDGKQIAIIVILSVVVVLLAIVVTVTNPIIGVQLKRIKTSMGSNTGVNIQRIEHGKGTTEAQSNNQDDSVKRRREDEKDCYEVLDGGRASGYDSVAMASGQRASAYDSVRAAPVQLRKGITGYENEAMPCHVAPGQGTSGAAPQDRATSGTAPQDRATSGTAPLDAPRKAVPSTVSDEDSYLHVYDYSGAGPREPPKLFNQ